MNHTRTYRVTAFFLALLVLFSTLSFTVEKHFCHEETYTALFGDPATFCVDDDNHCDIAIDSECSASCCTSDLAESNNCCTDSSEYIPGIKIEEQAKRELKIKYYSYFNFSPFHYHFASTGLKQVHATLYHPPNQTINFNILFQVFII